jgi:predicted small secreted protein
MDVLIAQAAEVASQGTSLDAWAKFITVIGIVSAIAFLCVLYFIQSKRTSDVNTDAMINSLLNRVNFLEDNFRGTVIQLLKESHEALDKVTASINTNTATVKDMQTSLVENTRVTESSIRQADATIRLLEELKTQKCLVDRSPKE